MPILKHEPDIFPENLLDDPAFADEQGLKWWAIYTISRREKDLMRKLRAMGIAHYSPIALQRKRSPSGRVRQSFIPLFSNYVFLCGTDEHRYQARTTNCVSKDLIVENSIELATDLHQIQQLLTTGVSVTPESKLQPGRRVRVISGNLAGHVGTIVQRRGETRLVVSVNFLQQGASVLLEDFEVEALD